MRCWTSSSRILGSTSSNSNYLAAIFLQIGQQLIFVVRLNFLGLNVHVGAQTDLHEVHHSHLGPQMVPLMCPA